MYQSKSIFILDTKWRIKIKSYNIIQLKNTYAFRETSNTTLTFSLMNVKVALKIFLTIYFSNKSIQNTK